MAAMHSRRQMLALLGGGLALTMPHAGFAASRINVVASFSILGDLVARVGGERVEVSTLVGPNGDAHVYEPKPDDARRVAGARAVFVNGLGFEGWMARLLEASGKKANVVTLSAGITKAAVAEDDHDHAEVAHGHDHGSVDPHAWQSVPNARIYVKNILAALCEADPGSCDSYRANAQSYDQELQQLDREIRSAISGIPESRRLVITSHDAFGYFGREYGVTFLAPEGVSTESEASARDVADLIRQIREQKATALFVESISDPRLIEQISRETGLKPGGALYSDALSDASGPAASYIAMMKHNASVLAAAMLGS